MGRDREISYAVTDLLEGDTLRVRIAQSALPWQKAVEIAVSVADALAAVHSRGIIHRDVKADNVFLTSDGRVKLLDLAWPVESRRSSTRVRLDPRPSWKGWTAGPSIDPRWHTSC